MAGRELAPVLKRLGRRLRLRDGWQAVQRSLWTACAAALVIQVAGRVWPIADLLRWTLVPLVVWLPLVVGWALLRPASHARVARRCDLELGLKERLATAVVLSSSTRKRWTATP